MVLLSSCPSEDAAAIVVVLDCGVLVDVVLAWGDCRGCPILMPEAVVIDDEPVGGYVAGVEGPTEIYIIEKIV